MTWRDLLGSAVIVIIVTWLFFGLEIDELWGGYTWLLFGILYSGWTGAFIWKCYDTFRSN